MNNEERGEALSEKGENVATIDRYDPGGAPQVPVRWKEASNATKLWCFAAAAHEEGEPILFTVLFTHHTLRKMNGAKMKPSTYIGQRMRNSFPSNQFFFVVEVSSQRIIHIHGVILKKDIQTEDSLRIGLDKVSGDKRKIKSKGPQYFYSRKASHMMTPDEQIMYKKVGMYGIYGWSQYCGKDIKRGKRLIGRQDSLLYVSRDLNFAARSLHKECVVPI